MPKWLIALCVISVLVVFCGTPITLIGLAVKQQREQLQRLGVKEDSDGRFKCVSMGYLDGPNNTRYYIYEDTKTGHKYIHMHTMDAETFTRIEEGNLLR